MTPTTYGYEIISQGDLSKGANGWMTSINFNWTRLDGHSHNGVDSVLLNSAAFVNAATVKTVSANYVVLQGDILVVASNTISLTLPDATLFVGEYHEVVNSGVGTITINPKPASGQKISGQNNYSLTQQYQFVRLRTDGSNWFVVGAG